MRNELAKSGIVPFSAEETVPNQKATRMPPRTCQLDKKSVAVAHQCRAEKTAQARRQKAVTRRESPAALVREKNEAH